MRPEVTARVYDRLHNLAEIALRAGQSVIVDAVHAKPEEREALAVLAARLRVPFTGLWLEAPVETLVARVEARQHDASDANAPSSGSRSIIRWARSTGFGSMPVRVSTFSSDVRGRRSICRRDKHRRAMQPAMPQIGQGFVGPIERVGRRVGFDVGASRDLQEIDAVLARQIGDREKLPFFPEKVVGKFGNIAHVNAGADDGAALFHRGQRQRHERADRRIDDRRIELFRRRLIGAAGPDGAEAAARNPASRDRRGW